MNEPQTPQIVDPQGRPARPQRVACPHCDSGIEKRVASGGFGVPHPVCRVCGYEWVEEVFRG